jgi:hypothetical protein
MGMKFINLPKSKQFKIGTRFYDPQKEAMLDRQERIRKELELEDGHEPGTYYHANIKGSFRAAGRRGSKTIEEARRKSNIRLFYILIILIALFYFLLK